MASSSSSFLFFILGATLSLSLSLSTADLIGEICPKTDNPPLCFISLRSDPRSPGSDKWGLGVIAVDKAVGAVEAAVEKAKSLENSSNKKTMDGVLQNFDAALDDLNNHARQILASKSGELTTLDARLTAAFGHVVAFRGNNQVEKLKGSVQNAADLLTVVGAISVSLRK